MCTRFVIGAFLRPLKLVASLGFRGFEISIFKRRRAAPHKVPFRNWFGRAPRKLLYFNIFSIFASATLARWFHCSLHISTCQVLFWQSCFPFCGIVILATNLCFAGMQGSFELLVVFDLIWVQVALLQPFSHITSSFEGLLDRCNLYFATAT